MAAERITTSFDLNTADGLQKFLFDQSLLTDNLSLLYGGYTSQVYGAELHGEPVVIKHTLPRESFYPVYRRLEDTRARTEVEVLQRLEPLFPHQVPKILQFFPDKSVIVMSDVSLNTQLGLPYFLSGKANPEHAQALGLFLAQLKQATAGWEPFETVEQPFEQIWTRGLEVELASPEWGEQLRNYYLGTEPRFVWVDGHPKNIFFANEAPLIKAIDFDCSHFADPDYMLPNFLGQIPVFTAMGHISLEQGVKFAREIISAYDAIESISTDTERKMVFYAGAQTIQRQDGKWLFDVCGGNDDQSLKRRAYLFYFGRKILTSIESFDGYIKEFELTLKEWFN